MPVLNIDICPTILDLAGLPIPSHIDGQSLLPLLKHEARVIKRRFNDDQKWRHTVLIERGFEFNFSLLFFSIKRRSAQNIHCLFHLLVSKRQSMVTSVHEEELHY